MNCAEILSIFKADLLLLLHSPNEHLQAISSVLDELELLAHRYKSQYQERLDLLSLQSLASQQHPNQQAHSGRNHGKPGKPPFLAYKEQITGLINLGFSFTKIGSMLGVHPRTLQKMRSEIGLPIGTAVYSQITDDELKLVFQEILQAAPNTGERLMQGAKREDATGTANIGPSWENSAKKTMHKKTDIQFSMCKCVVVCSFHKKLAHRIIRK